MYWVRIGLNIQILQAGGAQENKNSNKITIKLKPKKRTAK